MKKHIVAKKNELVEGYSNLDFLESKLVNKIITMLDSINDDDFKTIILTKKELAEYLNLGKNYKRLEKTVKSIPYKEVILLKERSYLTCYWFHVEVDSTTIEFRFDPKLKPYLLKLSKNYTNYDLKAISDFTCRYSFKMFEILIMNYNKQKQYKKEVELIIPIKEIRKMLFLENKYIKIYHLNYRVINPSIEDINQFSNIFVKCDKVLEGKITIAFKFTIKDNISNKKLFDVDAKDECLLDNEFMDIWNLYPHRMGLGEITKKERINICKIGIEKLTVYIKRYLDFIEERRKEFPHYSYMKGSTFFTTGYVDFVGEDYTPYKATATNKPEQASNFQQRNFKDEFGGNEEDEDRLYENFK